MRGDRWFAVLVGSAIGAFGAGRLSDRIGRRGVMILSAILFLISALLADAVSSSILCIIARVIGGLGVEAARSMGLPRDNH